MKQRMDVVETTTSAATAASSSVLDAKTTTAANDTNYGTTSTCTNNGNSVKEHQSHPTHPLDTIDDAMCRTVLSYLVQSNVVSVDAILQICNNIKEAAEKEAAQTQTLTQPQGTFSTTTSTRTSSSTMLNTNMNNTNVDPRLRTRHIALHVYYDGGDYNGLAENLGETRTTTTSISTIEREMFIALQKAHLLTLPRNECQYSRCGRTDKGVSAYKQILALQLKSAFPINASYTDPSPLLSTSTSKINKNDDVKVDCNHNDHNQWMIPNDELPNNAYDSLMVWVPQRARQRKYKKSNMKNDKASTIQQQQQQQVEIEPVEQHQQQEQRWVQKNMTEYAYDKILNNLLPQNIRIIGWCPVSTTFSSRFSCVTRTYRYYFLIPKYNNNTCSQFNTIGKSNCIHNEEKSEVLSSSSSSLLSMEKMKQGLLYMVGTHDFRNFCKMDVEKVYNFVRTIYSADIVVVDTTAAASSSSIQADVCYFQIVGQAFLWHQIRCIVHILFLIGRGFEEPQIVLDLFDVEQNPGKPSYPLANERPLVLHDCQYNNLHIGYNVSNLWNTTCIQLEQWEYHMLAAARIRNSLDSTQEVLVRTDDVYDFATSKIIHRQKKHQQRSISSGKVELQPISRPAYDTKTITWQEAQTWLRELELIPESSSNKLMDSVYIPLLQRSRGTTYEEKVMALQKQNITISTTTSNNNNTSTPVVPPSSSRRQMKYEQNVIKKRKTKEEDAEFYNYMTQQGGSSM